MATPQVGVRCNDCRTRIHPCRNCQARAERLEAARERAAQTRRTLPAVVEVKAVGVTFADDYPANLYRVKDHAATVGVSLDGPPVAGRRGLDCELVREPNNPYDANAVAIVAASESIGHVPRAIAVRLARELDSKVVWVAEVTAIVYWPDRPEQPGVWIRMRRAETAKDDNQ